MLHNLMNYKFIKHVKFQHCLFIVMLLAIVLGKFYKNLVEGFDNPPVELNAKVRYVTFHQGTSDYLQISQLAVYTTDDPNTNIAPRGKAIAVNTFNDAEHNGKTSIISAIDGTLEPRSISGTSPAGYHSANKSPDNYWKLDLGQAFNLRKIVYYNRNDNNMNLRSIGTYITLENATGQTVWTSPTITSSDLIQTWTFTQVPAPGEKGEKGLTGPQGIQGKIGPAGPKGDMGPAGPIGFLGFVDLRKKDVTGASAASYPPDKNSKNYKKKHMQQKIKPHNACDDDDDDDEM
jgi:hypothetical protein